MESTRYEMGSRGVEEQWEIGKNNDDEKELNNIREQDELLRSMINSPSQDQYTEIMQAAERKVFQSVEKLDLRLAEREAATIQTLKALESKRPRRIALLFPDRKAIRHWKKVLGKQKSKLARIHRQKSVLKAIRNRQSNYKELIDKWIYNRAKKLDHEIIRKHEERQEMHRRAEEEKRMQQINEITIRREQTNELNIIKSRNLERTIPTN